MRPTNQLPFLKIFIFICVFGSVQEVFAQLEISADVRQRLQYRHEFGNLFPDNAEPSDFVVQPSRLNFDYRLDRLIMTIGLT